MSLPSESNTKADSADETSLNTATTTHKDEPLTLPEASVPHPAGMSSWNLQAALKSKRYSVVTMSLEDLKWLHQTAKEIVRLVDPGKIVEHPVETDPRKGMPNPNLPPVRYHIAGNLITWLDGYLAPIVFYSEDVEGLYGSQVEGRRRQIVSTRDMLNGRVVLNTQLVNSKSKLEEHLRLCCPRHECKSGSYEKCLRMIVDVFGNQKEVGQMIRRLRQGSVDGAISKAASESVLAFSDERSVAQKDADEQTERITRQSEASYTTRRVDWTESAKPLINHLLSESRKKNDSNTDGSEKKGSSPTDASAIATSKLEQKRKIARHRTSRFSPNTVATGGTKQSATVETDAVGTVPMMMPSAVTEVKGRDGDSGTQAIDSDLCSDKSSTPPSTTA